MNLWLQISVDLRTIIMIKSLINSVALLGVYTFRSSDRPVGPTGRSDDRIV